MTAVKIFGTGSYTQFPRLFEKSLSNADAPLLYIPGHSFLLQAHQRIHQIAVTSAARFRFLYQRF